MTNFTSSSQSQGLLHHTTGHGNRDSEGLQSIHQDVYDAPQVCDPASEGLQSVDHDGRNGPQAVEHYPLSPDLRYSHSGHAEDEKTQPLVSSQHVAPTQRPGRRRLLWAILIAVSVAIAIAIGVGAGVGLSRQSRDGENNNDQQGSSGEYVIFLNNGCRDIPWKLTGPTVLLLPQTLHLAPTLRRELALHQHRQHHQPHPRSRRAAQLAWPISAAMADLPRTHPQV
jgi:hypothetical protein